jgi:hypothetical protein
VSTDTFDLAELLYEVKSKHYYNDWEFESFNKYAKSLEGVKYTKCYYLVAIVENGLAAALSRAEYEPVGLQKLRMIARLKPAGEYNSIPMPLVIRELTLKAKGMTPEEVNLEVEKILGLAEDESLVWVNFKVKKLARENVIRPALELIKKHMGQTEDDEGVMHDASDGAALEMMAANTLADTNLTTEDPSVPSTAEDLDANVTPNIYSS